MAVQQCGGEYRRYTTRHHTWEFQLRMLIKQNKACATFITENESYQCVQRVNTVFICKQTIVKHLSG